MAHLILFLLAGFLGLVRTVRANPPQANAAQAGSVTAYELILAMNTLRVSFGHPALIEHPTINAVAQATAETMAANNMSWHIGNVRGRIQAAGYGGGATVWATENFAVGTNMGIDQIMVAWADPDHMRPAANPAYCHVGAGVAQAANGRIYYILQAAYVAGSACGDVSSGGDTNGGSLPVPQIIVPVGGLAVRRFLGSVKLADVVGEVTQGEDGRWIVPLPHPSGASLWLNRPENRERVNQALAHLQRLCQNDQALG